MDISYSNQIYGTYNIMNDGEIEILYLCFVQNVYQALAVEEI